MTLNLLWHTDLDVDALGFLAAGTGVRLPAGIEDFDDLDFGTRSDVIKIFVLNAFVELDFLGISVLVVTMIVVPFRLRGGFFARSRRSFFISKSEDNWRREKRGLVLGGRHAGNSDDCDNTERSSKLSHGTLLLALPVSMGHLRW
jgi:hypothetical protein